MRGWTALSAGDRRDVQGIVVSGYVAKPLSRAVMIDFGTADPADLRTWLQRVNARVTNAADKATTLEADSALLQVALSADGLGRLRPDVFAAADPGFDPCFAEGMTHPLRARALGDDDPGGLVGGRLRWRGTAPAGVVPPAATAHTLLLLYAATAAGLDDLQAAVAPPSGAIAIGAIDTDLQPRHFNHPGTGGTSRLTYREHFGFADGMSQPVPAAGKPAGRHHVAIGDYLLGHPNAFDRKVPGPLIADGVRGAEFLRQWGPSPGLRSFGVNGTYLVVRELHQQVGNFWASMRAEADRLAAQTRQPATDLWLAQRLVGRGYDGDSFRGGQPLPRRLGEPENDFGYESSLAVDSDCPIGSHVRRANPRDGLLPLAPTDTARTELTESSNHHRILRRARNFGPPLADPLMDDGQERGLLFMAINADIARQFELIMRTWMLNPAFAALDDQVDPLVGPASAFSLPQAPVRLRASIARYVHLAGGDYYFLPSRSALEFLAS